MSTQWSRASPISVETMASQLKHCAKVQDLHQGKLIHAFITKSEKYAHNTFLMNSVVHMYGSCHSFSEAKEAFSSIRNPNTHSWNIFINVCVKSEKAADEVFHAFSHMLKTQGLSMNSYTCVCIVNACAKWVLLEMGRNVHAAAIVESVQCENELVVATALVKMYGRCGALEDARTVFDLMQDKDLIAWSSIMGAYTHSDHGLEAIRLYHLMKNSCFVPDQITCLCAIDACSCIQELKEGRRIHVVVLESGYSHDVVMSSSLVNMYGKCGDLERAMLVFAQIPDKNLITWNSAIAIFAANGRNEEAISFFRQMQLEGICPDVSTYISALNACNTISHLEDGKRLHSRVVLGGLHDDITLQTAMIAMYGKCEALGLAKELFHEIMHPDAISWCAIITACMHNGHDKEALRYFQQMHHLRGLDADAAIFVSVLDACGKLSALDKGQNLHSAIVENRHDRDITVATALINMYGKCGSPYNAEMVFQRIDGCRNMVTWSAMIAAYAHNGYEKEAICLFRKMEDQRIVPNEVTSRSVLTACSYAGEITSGLHSFLSRGHINGLSSTEEEHSLSIVDLLGRAGRLDEAEDVVNWVPKEKKVMAWACLLGACRMHDDVDRGVKIAANLFELAPDNAASYISLSNLYASSSSDINCII